MITDSGSSAHSIEMGMKIVLDVAGFKLIDCCIIMALRLHQVCRHVRAFNGLFLRAMSDKAGSPLGRGPRHGQSALEWIKERDSVPVKDYFPDRGNIHNDKAGLRWHSQSSDAAGRDRGSSHYDRGASRDTETGRGNRHNDQAGPLRHGRSGDAAGRDRGSSPDDRDASRDTETGSGNSPNDNAWWWEAYEMKPGYHGIYSHGGAEGKQYSTTQAARASFFSGPGGTFREAGYAGGPSRDADPAREARIERIKDENAREEREYLVKHQVKLELSDEQITLLCKGEVGLNDLVEERELRKIQEEEAAKRKAEKQTRRKPPRPVIYH